MSSEALGDDPVLRVELSSEAELEAYGASISAELDKAEAELNSFENRPFGGAGGEVMSDISRLRNEQFDMFRRHIEIEQQYRVARAVDAETVRTMSFSKIADTMREKEAATASLLNRLADFDEDLRNVISKVDASRKGEPDSERREKSQPFVEERLGAARDLTQVTPPLPSSSRRST